jgi:hypothetical protein
MATTIRAKIDKPIKRYRKIISQSVRLIKVDLTRGIFLESKSREAMNINPQKDMNNQADTFPMKGVLAFV